VLNACLKGDVLGLEELLHVGLLAGDFGSAEFLPYHRVVSGFHFHSDAQAVVACIEVLVGAGVPLDARDRAGSTVLHKSIQVLPASDIELALLASPWLRPQCV